MDPPFCWVGFILGAEGGRHKKNNRSCAKSPRIIEGSRLGRIRLIFRGVYALPFTVYDAVPNLRRRFSLAGLLVGIQRFSQADVAHRSVLAGKAIEQTIVSLRAVT